MKLASFRPLLADDALKRREIEPMATSSKKSQTLRGVDEFFEEKGKIFEDLPTSSKKSQTLREVEGFFEEKAKIFEDFAISSEKKPNSSKKMTFSRRNCQTLREVDEFFEDLPISAEKRSGLDETSCLS